MPLNRCGIGEGALQGVILAPQCGAEFIQPGVEHLEAAGIVGGERRRAARDIERRPLLGAGLGEQQRPGREVEGREPDPAGRLGPVPLPTQTAGDHQVENDVQVAGEAEHDALAEPAQVFDRPSDQLGDRRIDRAQDERAGQPHALERLADNAGAQGLEVDGDVGQLGHRNSPNPTSHRLDFGVRRAAAFGCAGRRK